MYNGTKKKIIIITTIIILVVILAVGGVFAYITTDLFKSNQTLFFKYLGQALEDIEYVENTQLIEIENKKQETPYVSTGTLQYQAAEGNNDTNANILSNMKLAIQSNVNKSENEAYSKAELTYQDENLFTLEYANSNNIYALKSDEIVTAFLGIENTNLKTLAQKLGVLDTSNVPDSIKEVNLNELLKISEEEKEHIKQTYVATLINTISKNNFKEEKDVIINKGGTDYLATAYRLDLNADELKQVEIALLQTLTEDSITLNLITTKAKLLGLDENYTQVNNLTNKIQKQINKINNVNSISKDGLNIIIYTNKGKVLSTEIILRNEIKYTIYGKTGENSLTRYLAIEKLNGYNEKTEIELNETRSASETDYNIILNFNNDIKVDAFIINLGTSEGNEITTNYDIILSQYDVVNSNIRYENKINFQETLQEKVISLDRTNCGVLNDYTAEQLQVLMQSIYERIEIVLNQKIELIGWNVNEQYIAEDETSQIEPAEGNNINTDQPDITINNVEVINDIQIDGNIVSTNIQS